MDKEYKPRIRPMLLFRTEAEGKKYIVVQDPERVSNTVMLPAELESLITMLDGRNTLRDLQVELTRQRGGEIIPMADIERLIEELDANLIIDSERFHETVEMAAHFWNASRIRKPAHEGQAYDKDPIKLALEIDGFYTNEKGPGKPEGKGPFVRGLLAPHIDIKSGGPTFAWAYREIARAPEADLYIIIGTAHHLSPGPFSMTRKDYMTPLGIMPTDAEFEDALLAKFNPPWLTHDAVHRGEHSDEFQAVFLQHALGPKTKATMVPILAGFGVPVDESPPPWEDADITGFLDALGETVTESGKRVTYIVGGDLAHIGPRYGDRDQIIPSDIEACMAKDKAMLEFAAKGDSKGFHNFIKSEGDKRNICGLPPLYSMLRLMEGAPGRLLAHDHWFDEETRSAVTYASMVWHE